ncbi:MAG TPA: molecular chaperone TorD family protein, partial [Ktedonobacterales bacterium]
MPRRPAARDAVRAGRAALLDTLADLFLRELEPGAARTLATDPALAAALQPSTDEAALLALRAEYTRLLLLEEPPYASLYLEAPPVIGGESARVWERALAAHGLPTPPLERAAASDHAGHYLRALASAERVGRAGAVLAEALRWLPQYLTAL